MDVLKSCAPRMEPPDLSGDKGKAMMSVPTRTKRMQQEVLREDANQPFAPLSVGMGLRDVCSRVEGSGQRRHLATLREQRDRKYTSNDVTNGRVKESSILRRPSPTGKTPYAEFKEPLSRRAAARPEFGPGVWPRKSSERMFLKESGTRKERMPCWY